MKCAEMILTVEQALWLVNGMKSAYSSVYQNLISKTNYSMSRLALPIKVTMKIKERFKIHETTRQLCFSALTWTKMILEYQIEIFKWKYWPRIWNERHKRAIVYDNQHYIHYSRMHFIVCFSMTGINVLEECIRLVLSLFVDERADL